MEGKNIVDIPIEKLIKSPLNPREQRVGIEELTDTVIESGLIEPLIVREKNGNYEVLVGSRRFEALKDAKETIAPCRVVEANDKKALEMIGIEDVQKEELQPYERGHLYKKMNDIGMKQEDIASVIGKSRTYVEDYINIARDIDPDVGKDAVASIPEGSSETKAITKNKLERIRTLPKPIQKKLAEKIKTDGMDSDEVREKAKDINRASKILEENKDNEKYKETKKQFDSDPLGTPAWTVEEGLGITKETQTKGKTAWEVRKPQIEKTMKKWETWAKIKVTFDDDAKKATIEVEYR